MQKPILFLAFLCTLATSAHAEIVPDTFSIDTTTVQGRIMQKYINALQETGQKYEAMRYQPSTYILNPYYYRLFAPATLYNEPVQKTMGIDWTPSTFRDIWRGKHLIDVTDNKLLLNNAINSTLMNAYVASPQWFLTTEREIDKVDKVEENLTKKEKPKVILSDKIEEIDLGANVEPVAVVVKRPNFWKFNSDGSLQFSQNYFSDNWYKGGEDYYSMVAHMNLKLVFDNKQKLKWENLLEMKLGFQTVKNDKEHKFRTNNDLLRLTSKIGYKAFKNWYYTFQAMGTTQFYPVYQANTNRVKSDFMSPFTLVVSLGMEYKLTLKKFNISANLFPIAYNFKFVDRMKLVTNFGLKPRHRTDNSFGPNILIKTNWNICKNVNWGSRIYWYSNLETTTIEWENTFEFSINKYLTCKLFLYPRIDDSSPKYKSEDMDKYFMFQEYLSLGLKYNI